MTILFWHNSNTQIQHLHCRCIFSMIWYQRPESTAKNGLNHIICIECRHWSWLNKFGILSTNEFWLVSIFSSGFHLKILSAVKTIHHIWCILQLAHCLCMQDNLLTSHHCWHTLYFSSHPSMRIHHCIEYKQIDQHC